MRICFVTTLSGMLPLLTNAATRESGGGIQVQTTMLADALAARGHEVCFVIAEALESGQGSPSAPPPRFRLILAYDREAGGPLRGLRRLQGLWRALRRADSDVYILQGAGAFAALILAFCNRFHRAFVFWSASATDPVCHVRGRSRIARGKRGLVRYGIGRAHLIIAQTEAQRQAFRSHMDRDAVVIPNIWPRAAEGDVERPIAGGALPSRFVLWVSNLRPEKRPEWVLDIASELGDIPFVIVGGPVHGYERLYDDLRARAAATPNVTFAGLVPFDETPEYFSAADLLLNTSAVEGYPNTYLQAWAARKPVVASFDPDGVIRRFGLGVSAESQTELASALRALWENAELRRTMGNAGCAYLAEHHDAERVVALLEAVLMKLLRTPASATARDN